MKRLILEHSYRAGVGHIGSALSVADIVEVLYTRVLRLPSMDDPDRDRFVLSKGHSALAAYVALHLAGHMDGETLDSYCCDDSLVGVHPQHALRGVDFTTGSLGQGLSTAAGAALGARMQESSRRVFALLSDAECNEGAVWEAAMFAAHHRLANLVAIIDLNGQQALGHTQAVLDMHGMAGRWRAFDWDVHEVDGHDRDALEALFSGLNTTDDRPHAVIARTVFGHGVSFMERQVKWHYQPMSEAEFALALTEVG